MSAPDSSRRQTLFGPRRAGFVSDLPNFINSREPDPRATHRFHLWEGSGATSGTIDGASNIEMPSVSA